MDMQALRLRLAALGFRLEEVGGGLYRIQHTQFRTLQTPLIGLDEVRKFAV